MKTMLRHCANSAAILLAGAMLAACGDGGSGPPGGVVGDEGIRLDAAPGGDIIRVDTDASRTFPENSQQAMAGNTSGELVIAWIGGADQPGLYFRRYSAAGAPVGGVQLANAGSDGVRPAVTMADDGRFVIAWQHFSDDAIDLRYRMFAADGTPQGEARSALLWPNALNFDLIPDAIGALEFRSGAPPPAVAMAPDGRFVIVWRRISSLWRLSIGSNDVLVDVSRADLYARPFAADGEPVRNPVYMGGRVSTHRTRPMSVDVDVGGDAVVAWTHFPVTEPVLGYDGRVQVQRVGFDGSLQGPRHAVAQNTERPLPGAQVRRAANGDYAVAWAELVETTFQADTVRVQRFAADGTALGEALTVNEQGSHELVMDATPDGKLALVWIFNVHPDNLPTPTQVFLRCVSADGGQVGAVIPVSENPLGISTNPTVAIDAQGRVAVSWLYRGVDESPPRFEMRMRRFDTC